MKQINLSSRGRRCKSKLTSSGPAAGRYLGVGLSIGIRLNLVDSNCHGNGRRA
jgi:hypothetical protein